MSFSIKAMCKHGELAHRRKTADAALKKARSCRRTGCYDVYITDARRAGLPLIRVRSDLPRTPAAARARPKANPPDKLMPTSRASR